MCLSNDQSAGKRRSTDQATFIDTTSGRATGIGWSKKRARRRRGAHTQAARLWSDEDTAEGSSAKNLDDRRTRRALGRAEL
jgi:hypothetical protein